MLPVATVVSCPSLHQWRPDNMVEEKKRIVRQLRTSTFRSYPRPSSGQPNQTKENIYSNTGSARSPLSPDVPDFSCAEKEPSFFYLSVRLPACLPACLAVESNAGLARAGDPSIRHASSFSALHIYFWAKRRICGKSSFSSAIPSEKALPAMILFLIVAVAVVVFYRGGIPIS